MGHFYIEGVVLLFCVWILYDLIKEWYSWRSLAKWGKQYDCKEVPVAPKKLPWGLERYSFLFTGLKGRDFLEDMIRKSYIDMGTYTFRSFGIFNQTQLRTADPANLQAILSTKFQDYELGPSRRENFQDLLGNGIFTADGEAWHRFRTQLRPQFTRDQVSDLGSANRHLQTLFRAIPSADKDSWTEADLKPLLYRFTMDVSTEFLFGISVDSQITAIHALESGDGSDAREEEDFAWAMNFAQDFITSRIRLGPLYWLKSSADFRRACTIVKAFTERYVNLALDPNYKKPASLEGKFVLLDALVAKTRDPIELRDQIVQTLLAGRDTTSALICWAILLLARDLEAFHKLRKAVIAQFSTDDLPTFESLKACKPITHVLYEALRLYPLVPLNQRTALRDTVLPTGGGLDFNQPIVVRKGESVGYSTYVLHRRPDIWGSDYDVFRPERWEGRKLGWEFIPFSGGARVCIGQQYALNEASFVLVKFLQRYDRIEAVDMSIKGLQKDVTLTLSPANGVKLRLHQSSP